MVLVKLYHVMKHSCLVLRNIYLVVAYAENGDLRRQGNLMGMTERRAKDFLAVPILHALSLLHKEGIVHRDLKPDNCLVDKDNNLMLADFGLSMYSSVGWDDAVQSLATDAESTDKGTSSVSIALLEERAAACKVLADVAAGTPLYTAPEVLLCMFQNQPMNSAVQPKNDVWAFGVMLLEVLTGIHPFSPESCSNGQSSNVMYNIAHVKSVSLPSFLSPALIDFLTLALQRNPEQRPSAAELLQHPWIKDPDGSLVEKGRTGSMVSLRLPSTCGTPSSRCSDQCGEGDDEEEQPLILNCAQIFQVNVVASSASHRQTATVAFEGQDCWED